MPLTVEQIINLNESEINDDVLEQITPQLIAEFQKIDNENVNKLLEKFLHYKLRTASTAKQTADQIAAEQQQLQQLATSDPAGSAESAQQQQPQRAAHQQQRTAAADEPEQITYYQLKEPSFIPKQNVEEIQAELVAYAEGKELDGTYINLFCLDPESGKYKLACVVAVDIYNRLQTEQKKFERKQELYRKVNAGYEYSGACAKVGPQVKSRIDQIKEGITTLGIKPNLRDEGTKSLESELSEIEINQYRVLEIHPNSGLFPTKKKLTGQETINSAYKFLHPVQPVDLISFARSGVEAVEKARAEKAAQAAAATVPQTAAAEVEAAAAVPPAAGGAGAGAEEDLEGAFDILRAAGFGPGSPEFSLLQQEHGT